MVTRPEHEIADFDVAAEWVGMPEYVPSEKYLRVLVIFESEEDRKQFIAQNGFTHSAKTSGPQQSFRWPPLSGKDDRKSILLVSEQERAS
jgi:hypothetical protein